MRILIEEYQYNVTDVKDTLYGIDALENVEGKVSVHYVGYYYNTLQRDCVFILPKVLLMDDKSRQIWFLVNIVLKKYLIWMNIIRLQKKNVILSISLQSGYIVQLLYIRMINSLIQESYIIKEYSK